MNIVQGRKCKMPDRMSNIVLFETEEEVRRINQYLERAIK